MKKGLIGLALLALVAGGCSETGQGAALGGLIGGAGGLAVGSAVGSPVGGALIGGGLGAAAGGLTGHALQEQRHCDRYGCN